MSDSTTQTTPRDNHGSDDVAGFFFNPLLTPRFNALLNSLDGGVKGFVNATPTGAEINAAFEGAQLYIPSTY